MCNDIATCEVMLEPITSPISESSDKIGEVKKFLNPEIIQKMDPTEKEFRERLDSMEQDEEVPSHIKPETVGKREMYYIILKRWRIISDIKLLNHMYGAVQAIGNLDMDIIDRYQAVKRKATKDIQKCNELLDATGREGDGGSEKSNESLRETIPNKTPERDNALGQESLMSPFKNKGRGPIMPIGGFSVQPDSGERGQEREKLFKTVKEITKGKGEIILRLDLKGPITYPKDESSYLESGWDRSKLSDNHYDLKESDQSWDYSDANIPYEGSYLTTTSETNKNVSTINIRGKPKGVRQRLRVSSTQTPYGNKTSVSVDNETQMTPQKANTPLRETMTKKTEGTVICSVKTGSNRKEKENLLNMTRQDYIHQNWV